MMKNKLGYTLVEIVTTTAIIGTLTAIALPNFLRVKMNVNMEMVKQHLRVIGQEMGELMNQDPLHQFPADIFNLGNSPGEFTITASLSGIDSKGYEAQRSGYVPSAGRTSYTFRTCPKEGLFGIAGDRCFILDTGVIRETDPWNGDGVAMAVFDTTLPFGVASGTINRILADPALSPDQRTQLLADALEVLGYFTLYSQMREESMARMAPMTVGVSVADNSFSQGFIPATLFQFHDVLSVSAETNKNSYKALSSQVNQILKDRGLALFNKTATVTFTDDGVSAKYSNGNPIDYLSGTISYFPQGDYTQVGFKFQNHFGTNWNEYSEARLKAVSRFYSDYKKFLGTYLSFDLQT